MATPTTSIDALPAAATPPNPADLVVVQQSGVTKKMPVSELTNLTSDPLVAHIADPTDAHDATAISATASGTGVDGVNVQVQLGQLAGKVNTIEGAVLDTVWVGDLSPSDPKVELWWDTDEAGASMVGLASDAETVAGVVADKAVTPAGLKATQPYFDVRSYGAVGDNVADDTAAIQAAINAATASVIGGVVLFPKPVHTYKVTSTLTVTGEGIKLLGPGRGTRCIDYTGTGSAFRFGATGVYVFRVQMEGIRLTNLSGSAAIGLELYVKECTFTDVLLNIGFTQAGIKLCDSSASDGCWTNRFMNCYVYNGLGDGLVSLRATNSNLFVGCHFSTNAGDNVFIPYTNGTEFVGCQFEGAGSGYEIHVSDRAGAYPGAAAIGLAIESCYFETKVGMAGARALMMNGASSTRFVFNHCKVYGMSVATYAIEAAPTSGSAWGEVVDNTVFGVQTATVGATTAFARIYVSGRLPYTGSFGVGSPVALLDNTGGGRGCSWNQSDQEILLNGKLHVTTNLELDGALDHDGTTVGFYNTTPIVKPTSVTARAALEALGLGATLLADPSATTQGVGPSVFGKSGEYWSPQGSRSTAGTVAGAMYTFPVFAAYGYAIDRIGVEVTVLAAGSTISLGIYEDDGTGLPGVLLVDGGPVSGAAVASVEATVSATLVAGRVYHFAALIQGGTPTMRAIVGLQTGFNNSLASALGGTTSRTRSRVGISGTAMPNPAATSGITSNPPAIAVRFA